MNLVQVVVEAILGRCCAPGGKRGGGDANRRATSPALAPRRCHPGPPSLCWSESSSPARECAQGRGRRRMTRKGGVGSPPHGPPILLLRASLLPPPDALSAPFPVLLPKFRGKSASEKGPGNEKQPGTGREASNCETVRTGIARVGAKGREPEGTRPRSRERTARAQLQLSAGAGAGRAGAQPSVRARSRPPSRGHLRRRAHPTNPRRCETARQEKERSARAKPRWRSPASASSSCGVSSRRSLRPAAPPPTLSPLLAGPTPPPSDFNPVPSWS